MRASRFITSSGLSSDLACCFQSQLFPPDIVELPPPFWSNCFDHPRFPPLPSTQIVSCPRRSLRYFARVNASNLLYLGGSGEDFREKIRGLSGHLPFARNALFGGMAFEYA